MKAVAALAALLAALPAALPAALAMLGLAAVPPARAETDSAKTEPAACAAPAYLLATEARLLKVAEAIKAGGRLDILVIGSRSAVVAAAPDGTGFPGRMTAALRERLPSIAIAMSLQLQVKKTAADVVANLGRLLEGKSLEGRSLEGRSLEGRSPTLVVWQTGTVDAIRSADPDDFRAALGQGIAAFRKAGADVVLVNLQYGPRMETMISTAPYLDVMRVVAQEREVPLFDRFGIMHYWSDTGHFNLFGPVHGAAMARRVHDCLGRALARVVLDAAGVNPPQPDLRAR